MSINPVTGPCNCIPYHQTCPYESWDGLVVGAGSFLGARGWAIVSGSRGGLSFGGGHAVYANTSVGGGNSVTIRQTVTPSDATFAALHAAFRCVFVFSMTEPDAAQNSQISVDFSVGWTTPAGGVSVIVQVAYDVFAATFISTLQVSGGGPSATATANDARFADGGEQSIEFSFGPGGVSATCNGLTATSAYTGDQTAVTTTSIRLQVGFLNGSGYNGSGQFETLTSGVVSIFPDGGATPGSWCIPPTSDQPVQDEIVGLGDGTTLTFTTKFPYVPASLDASVDQTHTPADPTTPTTGLFTLPFAPVVGETVRASYRYARP